MQLLQDLRFGIRMIAKRPGASALAIAALALGIGLTTTMFSIVDAAFLRGLPFEGGDRIVALSRQRPGRGGGFGGVPVDDFLDWRSRQHSFEDVAASSMFSANVSALGDMPVRYRGSALTPNLLHLLRVRPQIGRDFTEADAAAGAPAVVLLSDANWTSAFGRNPSAVGATIRINGEPTTIIGVMPPAFGFPQTADMWTPLKIARPDRRGAGAALDVVGRLKPDATIVTAQSDMSTIARQLAEAYPENRDTTVLVQPYVHRFIAPQIIATLSTMLAAVFGVLLIACVNVTNLQLARAAERLKEVAVRVALGASQGRIVQQLLVEGLLLSVAGAVVGLAIAEIGTRAFMRAIADTNPPFWIQVHVDARVIWFVTALSIVATLASSLVPAIRVARQSVNGVLKDESRSSTGFRVGAFSRVLVAVEMTLSFVLLVVSGLMIKSIFATATIHFPFATDVLFAQIQVDERTYPLDAQAAQLLDRVRERTSAVPGVTNVAFATDPPDGGGLAALTIQGEAPIDDAKRPRVRRVAVSPEFFDVLNVRARGGRLFTPADRDGGERVAIVTDTLASKFFPKGDALGRRVQLGTDGDRPWRTIVGIVPSLNVTTQLEETTETTFVPLAQSPSRHVFVFASRSAPVADLGPAIRRAVAAIDPNLAVFNVNVLKAEYDQRSWPFRVFGTLFLTFGLAALVMAAAGLYGVTAFGVRRRTQEIGVRMALGADRAAIIRLIVRQGLRQVAVGIVIGFGLGGLLGSSLKLLLYQVSAWDPIVFGTTVLVLAGTSLTASLVPAMRAASVSPNVALRND